MAEPVIKNVADTAFWVAYYRAKGNDRSDALFRDPFAKRLIGDHGKRISESAPPMSRYVEWTVVSRTVIIDRFIEKAISEGVDAVVNLGAGLDTRPYRMNLPSALEWIEADYPSIISHKKEALRSETPKCRLARFEVDLADAQKRREFFDQVVPQAKKVLILTEGVVPYLSPEQVGDLATDLLTQKRFHSWIAEYLHPKVYYYLKKPVRAKFMQNAPFRFFPDDWIGFFRNLGWSEKETRYNSEIAVEFKRRPPMPPLAKFLLPFLPKKVKEEAMRMTGYMVFERGR